jgi:hypothetical protein
MHEIDPTAAQRLDDRPHYIGLDRPFSSLPACTGSCAQGREPCVTPEACRLPETGHEDMTEGMGAIVVPAVFAVALFAALALVHFWSAA